MAKLKKSKLTKAISLMLALIFIVGSFAGCGDNKENETTEPATKASDATTSPYLTGNINPLTGETGYDKSLKGNRPVMVSVENHRDARPQWGITDADIVWEMVVEGGITRMLLMFSDPSRLPDKIGPTRSARHYFVELAEGFDSIFVHFGGSPQAYNALNNHDTDNIDGMSSSAFSRDDSRSVSSEHRAYTTKDLIVDEIADKEIRTKLEKDYRNPFKFNAKTKKLKGGDCTECVVAFSSYATYTLNYNKEDKLYYSTLNGDKFLDSDGNQQNFTNIVMLYVDVEKIPGDSKGRVNFDLSEGNGVYISNGTYQEITWEKGDYSDMLKLYNNNGKELGLNPGRSYFALVPSSQESACTIS